MVNKSGQSLDGWKLVYFPRFWKFFGDDRFIVDSAWYTREQAEKRKSILKKQKRLVRIVKDGTGTSCVTNNLEWHHPSPKLFKQDTAYKVRTGGYLVFVNMDKK